MREGACDTGETGTHRSCEIRNVDQGWVQTGTVLVSCAICKREWLIGCDQDLCANAKLLSAICKLAMSPVSSKRLVAACHPDKVPKNIKKNRQMDSQSRCALCSIATHIPTKGAAPLTKGVVCLDCWPHVERFRLRHAPASIEVVRGGTSYYVAEEKLSDSDFETMVWTTISDTGSAE